MNPAEEPDGSTITGFLAPADGSVSRHRSHRYPGRHRAVLVRYDEEEFDLISSAAAHAGLTPTGFVASVALAVAQATGGEKAARSNTPAQPGTGTDGARGGNGAAGDGRGGNRAGAARDGNGAGGVAGGNRAEGIRGGPRRLPQRKDRD